MKAVRKIKEVKPAPELDHLKSDPEVEVESVYVTMIRPDGTSRKTIERGSIVHQRNIERGFLEI